LGSGRWSAGPTAALVYSEGPWLDAILAYHLMSFAGNRKRGSVNQTYIEPQISYNLESGWYADVDPQMTYDWTADTANAWLIPMGADIGKAFQHRPPKSRFASRRLRPSKASGRRPAVDNARERNVPLPHRH